MVSGKARVCLIVSHDACGLQLQPSPYRTSLKRGVDGDDRGAVLAAGLPMEADAAGTALAGRLRSGRKTTHNSTRSAAFLKTRRDVQTGLECDHHQ